MLLDSKSRMVDSVFTKTGKYFILRGADPAFFAPTVLGTTRTSETGFFMGAVSSAKVSPFSMFTAAPVGLTTTMVPFSSQKRFWARVVKVKDLTTNVETEINDFGSDWAVLTDYDDPAAGLVDLVRSVVTGSYNSRVAPWEAGSLVSVEQGSIVLNGDQPELRHTWNGFDVEVRDSTEVVRQDVLAQPEFSQFVNGLKLTPTVRNDQGVEVPMRRTPADTFQTDKLSPRTIRNRLVNDRVQSTEVQVETSADYPNGALFKSRWIPVERKRFTYTFSDNEYTVETAQSLTVIQFDANLFFVGKMVPVGMPERPEITTNAFLRIFTVIFEDGT